jgi:hypothetical protein
MLDKQAKIAHRAVDVVCGLFFAVDKDLSHLPQQRTRRVLSSNDHHHTSPLIVSSEVKIPDTVYPGYGELTYPALQKLFHYLCELAPAPLRLHRQHSSFLDAGSGFLARPCYTPPSEVRFSARWGSSMCPFDIVKLASHCNTSSPVVCPVSWIKQVFYRRYHSRRHHSTPWS